MWRLPRPTFRIGAIASILGLLPGGVAVGGVVLHTRAVDDDRCSHPVLQPLQVTGPEIPSDPNPADVGVALRFAPVLRMDGRERLLPVDRSRYVDQARLWAMYVCQSPTNKVFTTKVSDHVTLEEAPDGDLGCESSEFRECHYYLRQPGLPIAGSVRPFEGLQKRILAGGPPTIYWHVDRRAHTVQYWFFYVYNAFLNKHQGDWEQITVGLDSTMSQAVKLGYSSHHAGQSRRWDQLTPQDHIAMHAIVYVAKGSHANYFHRGFHKVPECKNLPCDRSNGRGHELAPGGYALEPLQPPVLHGDYGPGNFIFHLEWGATVNVSDPQTRSTWLHPGQWLQNTKPVN